MLLRPSHITGSPAPTGTVDEIRSTPFGPITRTATSGMHWLTVRASPAASTMPISLLRQALHLDPRLRAQVWEDNAMFPILAEIARN